MYAINLYEKAPYLIPCFDQRKFNSISISCELSYNVCLDIKCVVVSFINV